MPADKKRREDKIISRSLSIGGEAHGAASDLDLSEV
jgi:hypothetical protein